MCGVCCFRPLSGFLLSNLSSPPPLPYYNRFLSNRFQNDDKCKVIVSVPYRGSYFLICKDQTRRRLTRGFRPLSGFLLSNQKHVIINT